VTCSPPPASPQGWGRLDLSTSLPLPGLTDAEGLRLALADGGRVAQGQSIRLRGLWATGQGRVTAALVYNDYPAPLMAAKVTPSLIVRHGRCEVI
jgi:hypothetical protein